MENSDNRAFRHRRPYTAYRLLLVAMFVSSWLAWGLFREIEQPEGWGWISYVLTHLVILLQPFIVSVSLLISEEWIDPDIRWERYVAEHEVEKLYGVECEIAESLSREIMDKWQAAS